MAKKIKTAIVGVGNCASLLTQGTVFYKDAKEQHFSYPELGGYRVCDIDFVSAFDVDKRKVGKRLGEAIFAEPNNTEKIASLKSKVVVKKGPVLDGIGEYLKQVVDIDESAPCNVAREIQDSGAEVVINYLPVGSYKAARFYADEAIKAGCAFVNCIPEFLASGDYAMKFKKAGLPIVGDDVKGQLGATILSRIMAKLFKDRGVELDRMYQLNFGGNTDFWNLLEESRLERKRKSKTESVQSQLGEKRLPDYNIKISPSDYVPWLRSRKVAQIRCEGRSFGGLPITIDMRLEVEDKSASAAMVVDAVRTAKIALENGVSGPLLEVSAWTMKSPPKQFSDYEAKKLFEDFILSHTNGAK